MIASGALLKMRSELVDGHVDYYLPLGGNEIHLTPYIGKRMAMEFTGEIFCIHCGAKTSKSFSQGYCYKCFQSVPQTDESVIRPELSLSHFGISRDMEWAEKNDLIDHFVYLAVTSDLKVGVTRSHQIPTRWIDQGATKAIELALTPNRHIAGVIEVFLKKFVSEKTAWQAMLKGESDSEIDLLSEKERLGNLLPTELKKYLVSDAEVTMLTYPMDTYPQKIAPVSFDKQKLLEGILTGIKGQYLILDNEMVFNIRKHNGYSVKIDLTD